MTLVGERSIQTERQPLVIEVNASFYFIIIIIIIIIPRIRGQTCSSELLVLMCLNVLIVM
jgi:hypothetical protein